MQHPPCNTLRCNGVTDEESGLPGFSRDAGGPSAEELYTMKKERMPTNTQKKQTDTRGSELTFLRKTSTKNRATLVHFTHYVRSK